MSGPKTTFEFDGDVSKVMAKLNELEAKINKTGKGGKGAGSDIASGFKGAIAGIAKVTAGLATAYAVLSGAGKALNTAAEFEQLQTRLENMYGSIERGREAFQYFQEVAATTPYSLQGVVEAGASLKAFGVDAEKSIKPVADLAAFMGIDVVEAAQAFGRAMAGGAGAADVLRERGILQLVKSFKGIDDLTKLTLPQFRKALTETIMDPAAGIVGATDKMSKTFKGAYSNMLDSVDQLANEMGKHLLPAATSVMQSIGSMVSGLIPRESQLLRENAAEFNALASILTDVNTEQDTRARAIKDLQDKYGSYLNNINLEKSSYDELTRAIALANAEFEKKIKIQAAEELLGAQMERQVAAQKKLYEMEVEYRKKLASNTFNVANQGGAYTPSEYIKQAMEQALEGQRQGIKKLSAEYKDLYKTMVEGGGIAEEFNKKASDAAIPDTDKSTTAAGSAGKKAADAYLKEWRGTMATVKDMDAPLWNEMVKWFDRVEEERAKVDEGFKLIGEQTAPATTDALKKSADETVANLQNLQNQLENVVGGLARAGVAGEDMGKALQRALQDIIAKAITLAVVFGIMQLIPGGAALTGGFGGFMKAGFGLGGAKASAQSTGGSFSQGAQLQSAPTVSIQVVGALEGQKFMTNTIKPGEARLSGRSF